MSEEVMEFVVGERVYRKDDNMAKVGRVSDVVRDFNAFGIEQLTYQVTWLRFTWPQDLQDDSTNRICIPSHHFLSFHW